VNSLELSDDGKGGSELFMDHEAEDTHHGGTTVVELDGALGELGLLIVVREPSDREARAREVSREGSLILLPSSKLQEANEGKDLEGTGNGDLEGSCPALTNIRELGSIGGDLTREADSSTSGDLAQEGKLADAAVLELDVTKTLEALLVRIIEHTQGVEEAKRRLGTELVLKSVEGGGGLAGLGRGKGSGRADDGSKDGGLHGFNGDE
jgi:hypothetical protein